MPMPSLGLVSAARLTSLATGRGGTPSAEEWPWVAAALLLFALVGTRILMSIGLTRIESLLVAGLSPLLVLIDAPIGDLSPEVGLAANATGCLVPMAVGIKIALERRVPWPEALILVSVSIAVSYLASSVVPSRGVLLQYRIPALVIGVLAAGLLYRQPERSGAAAFATGGVGVVIGADILHLNELTGGGAGRVVLGGAGLLDGILLVAVLAAAVAEGLAILLRALVRARTASKPTA
jgi:uncharacterized membrane protein